MARAATVLKGLVRPMTASSMLNMLCILSPWWASFIGSSVPSCTCMQTNGSNIRMTQLSTQYTHNLYVNVCERAHVLYDTHCQPLCGGYNNTSFAGPAMWLITVPMSQAMWWRPGRVRVPCIELAIQQWDYIVHTHHTVHKRMSTPGPRLHLGTCYCLMMLIHPPYITLEWPEFYACKMGYSASLAG